MNSLIAFPRALTITEAISPSGTTTDGPDVVFSAADLQATVSRNPLAAAVFDCAPYSDGILTFRFWTLSLTGLTLTGTNARLRVFVRVFSGNDSFDLGNTLSNASCNSMVSVLTNPQRGSHWECGSALILDTTTTAVSITKTDVFAKIPLSSSTAFATASIPDATSVLQLAPLDRYVTFTVEAYLSGTGAVTAAATLAADLEVAATLRRSA